MAFRTGFLYRACPDTTVTSRALLVECVCLGGHFGIFYLVCPVAVQADIGWRGIFLRGFEMALAAGDEPGLIVTGMMVAIIAGDIVSFGMLRMLKEHIAGGAAILDSNGLVRGFGGKGGVTEKTYDKKNDSHAVDQLQISA
jgi:hypothetical protein